MKNQRRWSLLQLICGALFKDLHRRFPRDQWDQSDLLPAQLRFKHRNQFGQNRIGNDRDRVILRDARLEMPRLQTEIRDVGGENLS